MSTYYFDNRGIKIKKFRDINLAERFDTYIKKLIDSLTVYLYYKNDDIVIDDSLYYKDGVIDDFTELIHYLQYINHKVENDSTYKFYSAYEFYAPTQPNDENFLIRYHERRSQFKDDIEKMLEFFNKNYNRNKNVIDINTQTDPFNLIDAYYKNSPSKLKAESKLNAFKQMYKLVIYDYIMHIILRTIIQFYNENNIIYIFDIIDYFLYLAEPDYNSHYSYFYSCLEKFKTDYYKIPKYVEHLKVEHLKEKIKKYLKVVLTLYLSPVKGDVSLSDTNLSVEADVKADIEISSDYINELKDLFMLSPFIVYFLYLLYIDVELEKTNFTPESEYIKFFYNFNDIFLTNVNTSGGRIKPIKNKSKKIHNQKSKKIHKQKSKKIHNQKSKKIHKQKSKKIHNQKHK